MIVRSPTLGRSGYPQRCSQSPQKRSAISKLIRTAQLNENRTREFQGNRVLTVVDGYCRPGVRRKEVLNIIHGIPMLGGSQFMQDSGPLELLRFHHACPISMQFISVVQGPRGSNKIIGSRSRRRLRICSVRYSASFEALLC
jgi:hypothetical protein